MSFSFRIERQDRELAKARLIHELRKNGETATLDADDKFNSLSIIHLITLDGIEEKEYNELFKELQSDRNIKVTKEETSTSHSTDNESSFVLSYRAGATDDTAEDILKLITMLFPKCAERVRISSSMLFKFDEASTKEAAELKKLLISSIELGDFKITRTISSGDAPENDNIVFSEAFISLKTDKKHIKSTASAIQKVNNGLEASTEAVTGFLNTARDDLREKLNELGLDMEIKDAEDTQTYFISESREPTEMELRIINRAHSERCSHTSLRTKIDNPIINDPNVKNAYDNYNDISKRYGDPEAFSTIYDIAQASLYLPNNQDQATTNSLVTIDGNHQGILFRTDEGDKLLVFDNESNSGRTSTDPAGGASACLGDTVKKLMRIFAEPYDAFRISGIASPCDDNTQRDLALRACDSVSEYARAIGVSCTSNTEFISENYREKHMEVSAALAVLENTEFKPEEEPPLNSGDLILLIGSRTGREGKIYNNYLKKCIEPFAEDAELSECDKTENEKGNLRDNITKMEAIAASHGVHLYGEPISGGNAVIQKKLIKLFRDKEFRALILKLRNIECSGIAMAASALHDSIMLNLDCVPLKYEGLNAVEVAFSETCERFLAVISPENADKIAAVCKKYGVLCTSIGAITDDKHFSIYAGGKKVAYLGSDIFNGLDTTEKRLVAIVNPPRELPPSEPLSIAQAPILSLNPLKRLLNKPKPDFERACKRTAELSTFRISSCDRGFDPNLNATSLATPINSGKTLAAISFIRGKNGIFTLNDQKLCSVVSVGLFPEICAADPYKGAYLAITEALSRLVAAGFTSNGAYMAIHQFYPSYTKEPSSMGNTLAAILGAFNAQTNLNTRSICGDFSLGGLTASNTSNNPPQNTSPTTAVFGISVGNETQVITASLKKAGNKLVILCPEENRDGLPDPDSQLEVFNATSKLLEDKAVSACPVNSISAAEAIMHMCFESSSLGFEFDADCSAEDMFEPHYGAIVVELPKDVELPRNIVVLGTVIEQPTLRFADISVELSELHELCFREVSAIYDNTPCPEVKEKLSEYISNNLSDFINNSNCSEPHENEDNEALELTEELEAGKAIENTENIATLESTDAVITIQENRSNEADTEKSECSSLIIENATISETPDTKIAEPESISIELQAQNSEADDDTASDTIDANTENANDDDTSENSDNIENIEVAIEPQAANDTNSTNKAEIADEEQTLTVSEPQKIKIFVPIFQGTIGEARLYSALNSLKSDFNIETVSVEIGFDNKSLRTLSEEINNCDALCICDSTDSPSIIAHMLKRSAAAITALRKRGGLIYGFGVGFSALLNAGLFETKLSANSKDNKSSSFTENIFADSERITITDAPLSGLSKKLQLIRVLAADSPFLCCADPDQIYATVLCTYDGRLLGDINTLVKAAELGLVPTVYCDKNGIPDASEASNICASMLGIDSLLSYDKCIFGQISFPDRVGEKRAFDTEYHPPLPIFKSMASYLSTRK